MCLSSTNAQVLQLLGKEGVLEPLSKVLVNYDTPEIIARTTRVLANVTTIGALQEQAAKMGFLPRLVDILNRHSQNAAVVQNVCAAVTNITYNGETFLLLVYGGTVELTLPIDSRQQAIGDEREVFACA